MTSRVADYADAETEAEAALVHAVAHEVKHMYDTTKYGRNRAPSLLLRDFQEDIENTVRNGEAYAAVLERVCERANGDIAYPVVEAAFREALRLVWRKPYLCYDGPKTRGPSNAASAAWLARDDFLGALSAIVRAKLASVRETTSAAAAQEQQTVRADDATSAPTETKQSLLPSDERHDDRAAPPTATKDGERERDEEGNVDVTVTACTNEKAADGAADARTDAGADSDRAAQQGDGDGDGDVRVVDASASADVPSSPASERDDAALSTADAGAHESSSRTEARPPEDVAVADSETKSESNDDVASKRRSFARGDTETPESGTTTEDENAENETDPRNGQGDRSVFSLPADSDDGGDSRSEARADDEKTVYIYDPHFSDGAVAGTTTDGSPSDDDSGGNSDERGGGNGDNAEEKSSRGNAAELGAARNDTKIVHVSSQHAQQTNAIDTRRIRDRGRRQPASAPGASWRGGGGTHGDADRGEDEDREQEDDGDSDSEGDGDGDDAEMVVDRQREGDGDGGVGGDGDGDEEEEVYQDLLRYIRSASCADNGNGNGFRKHPVKEFRVRASATKPPPSDDAPHRVSDKREAVPKAGKRRAVRGGGGARRKTGNKICVSDVFRA